MAKLTIVTNVEKPHLISQKTKGILLKAGGNSKNPSLMVNSGIRSPERQANAMYDNLAKGNRIAYAAPGREVVAIYDANSKKPKGEVVKLMIAKINELSKKEQRVSQHCVSEEVYLAKNIVDVDKAIPNPRDFVIELLKDPDVTRIITPFSSSKTSVYPTDKRISVDVNEPAIHVEIKQ